MVTELNFYDRNGGIYNKGLLYPNMGSFHVDGFQLKNRAQYLLKNDDYDKVKFLIGCAGDLSKNESAYTIYLSDAYTSNYLNYAVDEPYKLTDYWKESGVQKADEFAFLTNVIHEEWTGLTVKKDKDLIGLKSQNLRDHMNEAELIFTALAEISTRQIAETEEAKGVKQNAVAGKKGGKIAMDERLALEQKTGKKVITFENFLPPAKGYKKLDK